MGDLSTYLREQGFACSAINTNGYGVTGNLNRNQQELTLTFSTYKNPDYDLCFELVFDKAFTGVRVLSYRGNADKLLESTKHIFTELGVVTSELYEENGYLKDYNTLAPIDFSYLICKYLSREEWNVRALYEWALKDLAVGTESVFNRIIKDTKEELKKYEVSESV